MTGPQAGDVGGEALRVQLGQILSDALGFELSMRTAPSYADLFASLVRGEAQLAWMPPAMLVRALDTSDVTLLVSSVRAQGARYHGVIFVKASSAHRTLEDLRASLIAWVDPDSCAGYLFPRMTLVERHIHPDTFFESQQMLGSHEAVARAVEEGAVDAGATFANFAANAPPEAEPTLAGWFGATYPAAMRILVRSEPIPSDALVAAKAVDRTTRDRVADVMCRAHQLPGGATLLQAFFGVSRFEPTLPARYQIVRRALESAGA